MNILDRNLADIQILDNELIPSIGGEIAEFNPADFGAVSKNNNFLSRIQLFGSYSDICKEGKFPMGNWGVPRSQEAVDDLGGIVDVLVVHGRAKALRICDDGTIITKSNPKDPEFLKIAQAAETPNSGAMYGPEFLLWVPSISEFVTYFMSSKTGRRVSPDLYARMRKGASLKSELIKGKKYSWHGPVITAYTGVINPMPSTEEVQAAVSQFLGQKDSEIETVEAGGRIR